MERIDEEERENERRRQEQARIRAEKRRLFNEEQARLDSLMQDATRWTSSQHLRDYIATRKQRYLATHGKIESDCDFARWLVWAQQQADRLDPLVESPPSILDDPIPEEPNPRRW